MSETWPTDSSYGHNSDLRAVELCGIDMEKSNIYCAGQMQAPVIPCTRCHGNGHSKLKGPLLRTYNAIVHLGNPTVPEIVQHLGEAVHPTAVNRRVERLKAMKLVRSRSKAHDGVRYFTV